MANAYTPVEYLLDDQPRTLFPLKLTEILVERSARALYGEIERIRKTDGRDRSTGFLTQISCHAAKRGLHLRRTIKVDPVAELFIYDLVHKDRATFRRSRGAERRRFGYVFKRGRPVPATTSYGEFRDAVRNAASRYRYHLGVDIARYFNSVYHHDLVQWYEEGREAEAVREFDRYFREIVGGRSVGCLPQGFHPCKAIGASFLNRVERYRRLRCARMLRFMDDFFLFDNDRGVLEEDFLLLQRYLGERGLSLNAEKTTWGEGPLRGVTTINEVKVQLLERRRFTLEVAYGEVRQVAAENKGEASEPLTEEQVEYIKEILEDGKIGEEDAELVLTLIGERAEDELEQLMGMFERFPALARSVHAVVGSFRDKEDLCRQLVRIAKGKRVLTEDQLFWAGKIAEDHLADSKWAVALLTALYSHGSATDLTRAKILEIPWPDLDDMREEYLKGGRSDWLAWCSAVGSRRVAKWKRNHLLGYYRKGSRMNEIVAGCVREI